ncbi:hypothetical protein [Opitutus sp. ER46]|uniref:hypothetical protein n=1 Tax=Opitutus sp. ER46 TaxID=2161864 RepID=UPI000D3059F0|nr:hypothetical protein [Opitutus sp. ER46]PTX98537.1 hypothetical protein DB354_04540 [Opitutus sp. ER46]
MINRDQIVYHRGGLVFGLRGTDMVHVQDVANGLACGCVCEECHAPLVARNRGLVRMPHFAHASGQACHNTGEPGLVRSAAAILNEVRQLLVPGWGTHGGRRRARAVRIDSASAVIERGQRPEVLVIARERRLRLFIRPSERTPADLLEPVREAGVSAMQLAVPTDPDDVITAGRLADALVSDDYARWWLFNARRETPAPARPPVPAFGATPSLPPPEPKTVLADDGPDDAEGSDDDPAAGVGPRPDAAQTVVLGVAEPPASDEGAHPAKAFTREPGPRFCWRCAGIRDFERRADALVCSVCGIEFLGY